MVPGSRTVKKEAEALGLDKLFKDAGFEWREPGCSMCLGMNPDQVPEGVHCASTSNRNFEGRQGKGARTHLVSLLWLLMLRLMVNSLMLEGGSIIGNQTNHYIYRKNCPLFMTI